MLGALLLISANWCAGLAWIAAVALDAAVRIRYEEPAMAARFGEAYLDYRRRTGRLLPRLSAAGPNTSVTAPKAIFKEGSHAD